MNQEKIGKYIALKRKESKLTQAELAEQLGVTSKSVSRWENGNSMPDISLFNEICKILNITLEELLAGEKIVAGNNETIKYIKLQKKYYNIKLLIAIIISILLIILVIFKTFHRFYLECYGDIGYYKEIFKISDDKRIYTKFNNNYYIYNSKIDLKIALQKGIVNISDIINSMEISSVSNDGGSIYYQSHDKKLFLAVCNSSKANGDNHNIYISGKEDLGICTYSKREKLNQSCLKTKLEDLIISDKDNAYNIFKVEEITSGNIPSWEIRRSGNVNAYAVIKTSDIVVVNDFKKYFLNINKDYKYLNIYNEWYVFISSSQDINLQELNECVIGND